MQGRLVRLVGRGQLPDGTGAFLKLMTFPRAKDKLRYVHRALPALHEAALLAKVRACGIAAPEVLLARGARRALLPFRSLLITRELERSPEPASTREMAEVAARLARAGIEHEDLNAGNFVRLRDGRVAILDLQSARDRGRPLAARERLRMAAKLVASTGADTVAALYSAGLVAQPAATEPEVLRAAFRLVAKEARRRIERCLSTSTEFERRFGLWGVLHRRREVELGRTSGAASGAEADPGTGRWIEGGQELTRLWIGDRAREVLYGERPTCGALLRKSWWLLMRGRLYIPAPGGHAELKERFQHLLDGHARYRVLKRAGLSSCALTTEALGADLALMSLPGPGTTSAAATTRGDRC